MRTLVALMTVALLAAPALAVDRYVAASWNGWASNGTLMTEVTPGTLWQTTVSGPTGNQAFKVTDGTWSAAWPPSNLELDFGTGAAPVTITFDAGPFVDGWVPNVNRVGVTDLQVHGWEIMGSFNSWASPVATCALVGGVYEANYSVATPGTYTFKFRKIGDWGVSYGDLAFGGDISVTTTFPNENLTMKLDVAGGRYLVTPEPASLALLALGGLAIMRRR
jgi:hypothetical protein